MLCNIIVIQVVDGVYNVTFPVADLYTSHLTVNVTLYILSSSWIAYYFCSIEE
jgi:hypothetical protein